MVDRETPNETAIKWLKIGGLSKFLHILEHPLMSQGTADQFPGPPSIFNGVTEMLKKMQCSSYRNKSRYTFEKT